MATKNSGVPCYDKAGSDEPIFVLRAKDQCAPEVVEEWAMAVGRAYDAARIVMPADVQLKLDAAFRCAAEMREWQRVNGCKLPD